MKAYTTTVITGLDNQPHYAVIATEQPHWPIALLGPTTGPNAKTSQAEATFFADAGTMIDLLAFLASEFGNTTASPLTDSRQQRKFQHLVDKATLLITKHARVLAA